MPIGGVFLLIFLLLTLASREARQTRPSYFEAGLVVDSQSHIPEKLSLKVLCLEEGGIFWTRRWVLRMWRAVFTPRKVT